MFWLLLLLFFLVSFLLVVSVLLQKGESDVGSAFGSGMGQGIFGAGGVDTILTKATYYLGALFIVLALLLALFPPKNVSRVEKYLKQSQTRGKGSPTNPLTPLKGKSLPSPPQGKLPP